MAGAAHAPSLEWWGHRRSIYVVMVEDRVDPEKFGSECQYKHRTRNTADYRRAEEAVVKDCVSHECILAGAACNYCLDRGSAGGLESFQRPLANMHTV